MWEWNEGVHLQERDGRAQTQVGNRKVQLHVRNERVQSQVRDAKVLEEVDCNQSKCRLQN